MQTLEPSFHWMVVGASGCRMRNPCGCAISTRETKVSFPETDPQREWWVGKLKSELKTEIYSFGRQRRGMLLHNHFASLSRCEKEEAVLPCHVVKRWESIVNKESLCTSEIQVDTMTSHSTSNKNKLRNLCQLSTGYTTKKKLRICKRLKAMWSLLGTSSNPTAMRSCSTREVGSYPPDQRPLHQKLTENPLR